MAVWNKLTESSDGVTLETFARSHMRLLGVLSRVLQVSGALLLGIVMWKLFQRVSPDWLVIMAGSMSLLLGGLLSALVQILRQAFVHYHFDKAARLVRVEGAPAYLPYLPREIPFVDIRSLRFVTVLRKARPFQWRLELALSGDRFFPVTMFRDEAKGRRIAQTLQTATGLSLSERSADELPFREYKERFVRQFRPPDFEEDAPMTARERLLGKQR